MDFAACHVLYVDTRAAGDSYKRKGCPEDMEENGEVQANIRVLLSVFNGGTFIANLGQTIIVTPNIMGLVLPRFIRRRADLYSLHQQHWPFVFGQAYGAQYLDLQ